ncbi:MAG: OPT family oligopeptide transporter [Polyangiales bacterium]
MDQQEINARDREWLATVYRGDTDPQLTVRAIVLGMLLGALMSFSNLYVGLKIGWGLGVAITSSILAFGIMSILRKVGIAKSDFTALENNTMASCASAAGYMSSAGLVSAIPALDMMIRENPSLAPMRMSNFSMMLWLGAISVLGVLMAVPLKRQLINVEQLKFPSGVAAAETLKSMYSQGGDAILRARALVYSSLAGALLKFVTEAKTAPAEDIAGAGRVSRALHWAFSWKTWTAPEILSPAIMFKGYPLASFSVGLAPSSLMLAAGAIIGLKIGVSLFLGSAINYLVLAPWLIDHGVFEKVVRGVAEMSPAAIKARHHIPVSVPPGHHPMLFAAMRGGWSVWPGTSLMVTAGLLSFAFKWRMVVRAFSGLGARFRAMFGKGGDEQVELDETQQKMASIEVPASWFVTGFILSGVATVLLQNTLFGIKWWIGIGAVLLTFLLSIVAARATGETDITPIGAMGKITQLMFGGFAPTQPAVNLMTANVTAGAASHAADLLTDLKTGHLLGGSPRKQFIAQMFGVFAGSLACVPVYRIIARPETLGTTVPAPAAVTWKSVAELLTKGFDALPMFAKQAMIAGAILGAVLATLEEFAPKTKKYLPSSTGLGIALVIDFKDSFAMFLGAVIAWVLAKKRADLDERYTVAVSSGVIAGESLMGVALAFFTVIFHTFAS